MNAKKDDNVDFEIGEGVHLKNKDLKGVILDKVEDLFMVELEDGLIDAYYSKQLELI